MNEGNPAPTLEDAEFAMVMPASWRMIDLRPATRDGSIQRMVREALGRSDQLASLRRSAATELGKAVEAATSAGCIFAATYEELVGGWPLSATALAFLGLSPLGPDGPTTDVETIVTLLEPTEDEELSEGPDVVTLTLGDSVRTRSRISDQLAGAETATTVDIVRYFVPVPAWDRLLVMAFSTPMLYAADAMTELFDQMALGARWRVGRGAAG
ncbi:MAG: hypothetical protein J2P58_09190 [Acidimicrobiaceae bacterium]|nr:hypothetical protein [Acidimicrobiaceae bacterium]